MLLILAAAVAAASAQSILPSTADSSFPACALSCQALLQAQTSCVPPAQAVTDQFVYDQCFCQQSEITGLFNSPDGVCDTSCTAESDRDLLQSWFISFCNQVAHTQVPTEPGAASTSSTSDNIITSTLITPGGPTTLLTSSSPSVVVVTITDAPTQSAVSTTGSSAPISGTGTTPYVPPTPWIDNHWRWILMLAILIIGLSLLAWFAVWFKRRHMRKVEEERAAVNGFPVVHEKHSPRRVTSSATLEDMFGPHQHQHLSQGWEYTNEQRRELGLGIIGNAIRKKSRERRREGSRRGKTRETVTKVKEFKSTRRSRSQRRADVQREMEMDQEREQQERMQSVQEKDIEKDPDVIKEG